MSIYGFATRTPEITPIANDTLIPNFTVYTRKTETGTTQLNNKINPQITDEEWVDIPNRVMVNLTDPDANVTVGKLAALYASEAIHTDGWARRYDEAREDARRAIYTIGDRLITESEQRSWCSEFDEIIDEVNAALPNWLQLTTREREYNITWTEEYSLTVRRHATVTAKSAEEAAEMVADWDEADDYEMRDAISYGNYSFISDNGDCEVEEA